jgi:hypothetical protein
VGARRAGLTVLEGEADPRAALAYLAATELDLDEAEVTAACRRAMLLLAAGGDPRRPLDPAGRAVQALAGDLREVAPGLEAAVSALEADAHELPRVGEALAAVGGEAHVWLAVALLAEEVAGEPD